MQEYDGYDFYGEPYGDYGYEPDARQDDYNVFEEEQLARDMDAGEGDPGIDAGELIKVECQDELLHTEANNFFCRDHTCPCWQAADSSVVLIAWTTPGKRVTVTVSLSGTP